MSGKDKKQDSDNQSTLKQSNSRKTTLDENGKIIEAENEGDDDLKLKLNKDIEGIEGSEELGTHKKKRKRNVESRDVWT
jgi:cell division protein FtsI/penicillin-binding protein 2